MAVSDQAEPQAADQHIERQLAKLRAYGDHHRPRRRWRRVGLVAVAVVGLAVMAMVAVLALVPGVGDAPTRVAAIVGAHGGREATIPSSARVARAVVAVEDQRFYAHHGIDLQSVVRVGWATLFGSHGQDQGGSTIAQQLAKQLYTGDRHDPLGELRQLGLALKLERRYRKPEILSMYLNAIYYGQGRWGITQASAGYFHKSPRQLDWAEASLLAGLPQAPSAYDPTRNFAGAQRRQRHVLDRLVETGVLTIGQADAAYGELARRAPGLGFQTTGSPP
jgi:membrane peptidoglycan carboxypeptidase